MFPMLRSLYLHDDGLYYESWDIQQLSGLRALTTLEELKLGLPVPIVQREFDTLRYATKCIRVTLYHSTMLTTVVQWGASLESTKIGFD
jgi:hypothetical protein